MKLSVALIAAAYAGKEERQAQRAFNQARALKRQLVNPLRYVYQFPICESVDECVNDDNPRCDGEVFYGGTGSISHRGYADYFNCRWEIQADEGYTVGLKFFNDFDLEFHNKCGFDRVHIRCLDDPSFEAKGGKPISRLCGPLNKNNDWAYDALKVMPKKSFFKESTDTNCKRILIEFNTDQDTQGTTESTGFTLGYYQQPHNVPTDPCEGSSMSEVISCLKKGAFKASVDEYENQINNATGKMKQRLIRIREARLGKIENHVLNYLSKMQSTISQCGAGFAQGLSANFLSTMQTAVASGSADEMFKLWNLFAVKTLTGNGVTCNWYTPGSGAEGIEESSFPCRTRRLFLRMKGLTQFGQYTECEPHMFDINDNELF